MQTKKGGVCLSGQSKFTDISQKQKKIELCINESIQCTKKCHFPLYKFFGQSELPKNYAYSYRHGNSKHNIVWIKKKSGDLLAVIFRIFFFINYISGPVFLSASLKIFQFGLIAFFAAELQVASGEKWPTR